MCALIPHTHEPADVAQRDIILGELAGGLAGLFGGVMLRPCRPAPSTVWRCRVDGNRFGEFDGAELTVERRAGLVGDDGDQIDYHFIDFTQASGLGGAVKFWDVNEPEPARPG